MNPPVSSGHRGGGSRETKGKRKHEGGNAETYSKGRYQADAEVDVSHCRCRLESPLRKLRGPFAPLYA